MCSGVIDNFSRNILGTPENTDIVIDDQQHAPCYDNESIQQQEDGNVVLRNNIRHENTSSNDLVPPTRICRFYKKGCCTHGIKGKSCRYDHPPACKKLLRYGNKGAKGCKLGAKCSSFHPRMCADSISKRECFNAKCEYVHVKGTIRKKQTDNDLITPEKATHLPQDSQQPNFLELIYNFKREILEFVDRKINQTQPHSPPTQQPFQQVVPQNFPMQGRPPPQVANLTTTYGPVHPQMLRPAFPTQPINLPQMNRWGPPMNQLPAPVY